MFTTAVPARAGRYRYQTSGAEPQRELPSKVANAIVSVNKTSGQISCAFTQSSCAKMFVGLVATHGSKSNPAPCNSKLMTPSSGSFDTILSTALFRPGDSGSNLTATVRVPPGGTTDGLVEPTIRNCSASAPRREI